MFALLLIPLALAGRLDRVIELQTAGEHAEVIDTVAKWESAGALGDEAAAVYALRDRSAFILAQQAHTIAAFAEFQAAHPTSRLAVQALHEEWALAFSAAQGEGSSAAMLAYVEAYPTSSYRDQVLALEAGFAYQEAVETGTPDAIATFTRLHPDSPYAENAWESLAAKTPGIHVRLNDGLPRQLPAVPVKNGRIVLPGLSVVAPARPIVAVNLPGTGRGETSTWWKLVAVDEDGKLGVKPPMAPLWEAAVGATPPDLLELVALPGTHAARVAAPLEPLIVPGACSGKARFAYVLTSEGVDTAFPFAVDCKAQQPEQAASPVFFSAFGVAERGDPAAAGVLWEQAKKLPGGARLAAWMATLSADAKDSLVTRRPRLGDVLAWDGTETTWWHSGEDGPMEMGRRPGLWMADGPRLWEWQTRVEPWSAPAGSGCKAASGERTAGTLVDRIGGEHLDIAFEGTVRSGVLSPKQYAGGTVTLLEEPTNEGCPSPGTPLPRTVTLPGSRRTSLTPDWAGSLVAGAAGTSVISEDPWTLYTAFSPELAGAKAAP